MGMTEGMTKGMTDSKPFVLAPWRSQLARALHRNRSKPESRYFQLATVTAEGRPANRTVVFRGFAEASNQIQLVTDGRSDKLGQLQANPWAEACWYFTQTREQFRLTGRLSVITADHPEVQAQDDRRLAWQKLSDGARQQFHWPQPKAKRQEDGEPFATVDLDPAQPLDNFCLVRLDPLAVDHLELRGDPQNRTRYVYQGPGPEQGKGDGGWDAIAVNP
jgi:pyridoxamine 5'-phosphate oxidase